jgi:hypothetical protein
VARLQLVTGGLTKRSGSWRGDMRLNQGDKTAAGPSGPVGTFLAGRRAEEGQAHGGEDRDQERVRDKPPNVYVRLSARPRSRRSLMPKSGAISLALISMPWLAVRLCCDAQGAPVHQGCGKFFFSTAAPALLAEEAAPDRDALHGRHLREGEPTPNIMRFCGVRIRSVWSWR